MIAMLTYAYLYGNKIIKAQTLFMIVFVGVVIKTETQLCPNIDVFYTKLHNVDLYDEEFNNSSWRLNEYNFMQRNFKTTWI